MSPDSISSLVNQDLSTPTPPTSLSSTSTNSNTNASSGQKRIRATGEALEFLISEFETNPNPSPERRKFISDKAQMNEKAVRIWFQNRRAKQRKFERQMLRKETDSPGNYAGIYNTYTPNPPTVTTDMTNFNVNGSAGGATADFNDKLKNISSIPVEVNEKYCFIDCRSLSVGSWQRIKTGFHQSNLLTNNLINLAPVTLNQVMSNADLLIILLKKNLELNYFFLAISNNSRILFRIFYPLNAVVKCSLFDNNYYQNNNTNGTNSSDDNNISEIRLNLCQKPKFLVYFFNGSNTNNQWSICDDFSEGQQVSCAFAANDNSLPSNGKNQSFSNTIPHVLVGSTLSLQYLSQFILQHQQRQRQQQRQAQPQPQPQPHNQFDFNSQPFETIPTSAINNNFNTTKTVNSSSMQGFVPGDFQDLPAIYESISNSNHTTTTDLKDTNATTTTTNKHTPSSTTFTPQNLNGSNQSQTNVTYTNNYNESPFSIASTTNNNNTNSNRSNSQSHNPIFSDQLFYESSESASTNSPQFAMKKMNSETKLYINGNVSSNSSTNDPPLDDDNNLFDGVTRFTTTETSPEDDIIGMFTSQAHEPSAFELANGVTLSGSSYTHINNGSLTKSDKTFTGLSETSNNNNNTNGINFVDDFHVGNEFGDIDFEHHYSQDHHQQQQKNDNNNGNTNLDSFIDFEN